ncbi:MAG: hypothetical protein QGH45_24300 [Myxococcota bacterium]|jgi:hypothetical protein|nr:hypothetical protein [Myxococcota bacterium]
MSDQQDNLSSARATHPEFVRTKPTRVRVVLNNGSRCIGNVHVEWPDGRVSDVLNDTRSFLPMTGVAVEGDGTHYDFLTVNKHEIQLIYEISR